jgi:hypothetical protein
MSLHKSGDFISDVELQFEWYVTNASWEVAELYLKAAEVTCLLLPLDQGCVRPTQS